MDSNTILEDILRREGGYVNNPKDLGGPTNYGITKATLEAYRKKPVADSEVANLKKEEAKEIYKGMYLDPFSEWEHIPQLFSLIVDSAVQHGVSRVKGWLAEVLTTDPTVLYKKLLARRIKFYGEIITKRPQNAEFAAGWMNRISEFIR